MEPNNPSADSLEERIERGFTTLNQRRTEAEVAPEDLRAWEQTWTRRHIASWVVRVWVGVIAASVIVYCADGFGLIQNATAITQLVELVKTSATPLMALVLGYYFATSGR